MFVDEGKKLFELGIELIYSTVRDEGNGNIRISNRRMRRNDGSEKSATNGVDIKDENWVQIERIASDILFEVLQKFLKSGEEFTKNNCETIVNEIIEQLKPRFKELLPYDGKVAKQPGISRDDDTVIKIDMPDGVPINVTRGWLITMIVECLRSGKNGLLITLLPTVVFLACLQAMKQIGYEDEAQSAI